MEYDDWMENAEDMNIKSNVYNDKYKELENYVLPLIKNVLK